jgi:hypothetical protein
VCTRIPLATMVRVGNDAFLAQLAAMFAAQQASGTVFINMKRCE